MARRPFGENGPLAAARIDVDCHQVAGHSCPVEADAPDTRYLAVYPRVVMAEKAHKRPQAMDQSVKPRGFTYPAVAIPVLLEPDPCGCIVDKNDVHRGALAEGIDLIARVMALRVALKVFRLALEVGGSVTTSNSAHAHRAPGSVETQCLAVPEMEKPGQHFGCVLCVEPEEVFVVTLDEYRPPRCDASVGKPRREVAGAVVFPCRPVDAIRIRPNAEITHVKYPLKAVPKRVLERKDVVIHPIDGSVDIAGSAKQHRPNPPFPGVQHPVRGANWTLALTGALVVSLELVLWLGGLPRIEGGALFKVHLCFAVTYVVLILIMRFVITGTYSRGVHVAMCILCTMDFLGMVGTGVVLLVRALLA